MRKLAYILAITCCGVLASRAQESVKGARKLVGAYTVYVNDKQVETDAFEVVRWSECTDQKTPTDPTQPKRRIEMKYEDGKLHSYTIAADGLPESRLEVQETTVRFFEHEALKGDVDLEEFVLVFEPTVFAHYALLVHAYQNSPGGKQTFNVLIPSQQDFLKIEVERHGSDAIRLGERDLTLAHYKVAIGRRESVNLWMDGDKLIAIHMTNKNLFAVDAGYDNLFTQIKMVAKRAM